MTNQEPRKPRVFEPDDPALVVEPEPAIERRHRCRAARRSGCRSWPPHAAPISAGAACAGARCSLQALAGAASLGAVAWFARLVSAALARDDWVGTATLALLLIAARRRRDDPAARDRSALPAWRVSPASGATLPPRIAERDQQARAQGGQRLAALYAGRPELAWSVRRFRDHARDVHDAGELLALADREIVAPLDAEARRIVTRSAKRVATVTAMSPMVLIAVSYVLIENLRLLRTLATLYGGRPGVIGVLRLARMVFTHIVATGGIAMTDDLLGQFLGQDLLRRLSRRLGEGAFNGALTARIGVDRTGGDPPPAFPRLQAAAGARHSRRSAQSRSCQPAKRRDEQLEISLWLCYKTFALASLAR